MLIDLAKKSPLGKAKEKPDEVRRVIEKLRNEGILTTIGRGCEKVDEPMVTSYSSEGMVPCLGTGV
jgi:hypothetical protein